MPIRQKEPGLSSHLLPVWKKTLDWKHSNNRYKNIASVKLCSWHFWIPDWVEIGAFKNSGLLERRFSHLWSSVLVKPQNKTFQEQSRHWLIPECFKKLSWQGCDLNWCANTLLAHISLAEHTFFNAVTMRLSLEKQNQQYLGFFSSQYFFPHSSNPFFCIVQTMLESNFSPWTFKPLHWTVGR